MIPLDATYQQTKRVVDSVMSTYQTVLTIVGQSDIVGTYNCTVENARGRASRTVVISSNGKHTCMHVSVCVCLDST